MTHSKRNTRNPVLFTFNPDLSQDAYFAALAPAFRAALWTAMLLFSKVFAAMQEGWHYDYERNSAKYKIAFTAFFLFMATLPGSREEKTEFLFRLLEKRCAQHMARLKELRAEYIIWRQRKCWMWSGGFRSTVLACLPDVFAGAKDGVSLDALIPD